MSRFLCKDDIHTGLFWFLVWFGSVHELQMRKMKKRTRAKAQIRFGGSPEPFIASDLPTYHDICQ